MREPVELSEYNKYKSEIEHSPLLACSPNLPPPSIIPSSTISSPTTMAISPEEPAIDVRKLCFSYQGNNSEGVSGEQTLEDIDLDLPQGARCLLIGANGCKLHLPVRKASKSLA